MVIEDLLLPPDLQSASKAGETSGAIELGVFIHSRFSLTCPGAAIGLSTNSIHRITLLYLGLKVGKPQDGRHLGSPNSLYNYRATLTSIL